MPSAGPLETVLGAIAASRLRGAAEDGALRAPADWQTGAASVLPAAVGDR